ncbi:hypothetical protein M8J77_016422 [Diaphorina citri]|nr:hypothetical protein M8J77_016422 [Diaphorina citri]
MDADQFQQFLATMTQLIQTMKPQLTQESTQSNLVPFENYISENEKFSSYLERFSNYCAMKNITSNEKKAQLLCVSIGSVHYNNLVALLGQAKPVNKLKYKDLVTALEQMLSPKKSTVVSQHYFLSIYQKEHQSIPEYVASLQRDIVDCDFNTTCTCTRSFSIADTFLRAQFIRGLRDNWIREQLLQSTETEFKKIVEKATALEASRIECKELASAAASTSNCEPKFDSQDVHKTSTRSRSSSRHYSRSRKPSTSRYPSSNSKGHKPPHINLQALGLENCCLRCGNQNHKSSTCRTRQLKCNSCGKVGHISRVCISSLLKQKQMSNTHHATHSIQNEQIQNCQSDLTYGMYKIDSSSIQPQCEIIDLFEFDNESDKYMITVLLNGTQQTFEVDSGAKFSLLSESQFNKLDLNLTLHPSNLAFRSYTGNVIKPLGRVTVRVQYEDKEMTGDLHIVPDGHDALLGRQWIRGLNIELNRIDRKTDVSKSIHNSTYRIDSMEEIYHKFSNVFEEKIGCVPDCQVSLQLRENAKPVFTRERSVPYALQEKVDKELDSLEAQGIISPVSISDWGSPLVCIQKPDGNVRLCVDYKCGVNERLIQANHPIRTIDDVIHSLRDSKYFCKLDLYKAYLHLKVDDESAKIQAIQTHRGTYLMHRLSFGIKVAPSEFNRILSQILRGLNKVDAYFDDIVVHGKTIEECTANLFACLQRLSDYDLHVNKSKCSFFLEKIDYLGYLIEHNKISKSPEKVRAIQNMPRPSNSDEVRRFLGLVTYYSKFIPDFSSISYPLRCLLRKNKRWFWTSQCEAAFLQLKSIMCSDKVLVPFDPHLPLTLTTDASPYGIASVLSHVVNNTEHPIAYASRSLTSSEQNYSQLDREALAIVFGVTHFYNYLFGKHFTLVTDNQPLTRIFHPNKSLPQMTSARLLRYASFLSGFNYSVQFKKGKDNQNVDCLSRAPISTHTSSPEQSIGEEVNQLYGEVILQISSNKITSQVIKLETENDTELRQIIRSMKNNSNETDYTLVDGILFRKDRVVIPTSLRSQILAELHETHLGVTKMKQLSRRYVYWPNIDRDIERLVRSCEACAKIKTNPPKVTVHPWECPQENWERVHVDYAGPFQNAYFLVCVDAKSKWIEVRMIKNAPTSSSTIELLENIFSSHGYPVVLVSDNHSIFQSEQFHTYCTDRGIFQKFIAPGHPATNGLAERNVQTLKNRLKTMAQDSTLLHIKLQEILLRYRATPLACGKTPAELYLKRNVRIRLDAVFPYRPQPTSDYSKPIRSLQEGERVQVRLFLHNKYTWEFGTVTKCLGTRHYLVLLDTGRTIKRHINQLRPTLVPKKKKTVTFRPPQLFNVPRIPQLELPVPPPQSSGQPDPPAVVELPAAHDTPPASGRPVRNRRPPVRYGDYVMH